VVTAACRQKVFKYLRKYLSTILMLVVFLMPAVFWGSQGCGRRTRYAISRLFYYSNAQLFCWPEELAKIGDGTVQFKSQSADALSYGGQELLNRPSLALHHNRFISSGLSLYGDFGRGFQLGFE
jgi:hypothetical protein